MPGSVRGDRGDSVEIEGSTERESAVEGVGKYRVSARVRDAL